MAILGFSNPKGNREAKTLLVLGMNRRVSRLLLRMVVWKFSSGREAKTLLVLGINGPVPKLPSMVI